MLKLRTFLVVSVLLLLFSCDNSVEGEAEQVTETNHFTFVHPKDFDEDGFQEINNIFWQFCDNFSTMNICKIMAEEQTTRIIIGQCEKFRVHSPHMQWGGLTIHRSEGNEHGAGQDIYLCNLSKDSIVHELAHAIINEYQRSYFGISRALHEACAYGAVSGNGAKWNTWNEIGKEKAGTDTFGD